MDLTPPQQRAIDWDEGPLLLLGGAGSGKTEVLARRLARLAAAGGGPERIAILTSTRAGARRLRRRVEALLEGPYEELWVGTWEEIAERLLRESSPRRPGSTPSSAVLGRAERLAILLDHLDELPLRKGMEIRGNPAGAPGPAAGADRRAQGGGRAARAGAGRALRGARPDPRRGGQHRPRRPLPDPQPDALRAARGARPAIAARFTHWMVDEFEEATAAQRALLTELAAGKPESGLCANLRRVAWREGVEETVDVARRPLPPRQDPPAESIVLNQVFRKPGVEVLALRKREGAGAGGGAGTSSTCWRRGPRRKRSAC